jgi:hypothetical protein
MALIKCSECKTDISDKATTCPKCGAPVKKPQTNIGCGGAVVATIIGALALSALMKACDGGSSPQHADTSSASNPSYIAGNSVAPAAAKDDYLHKVDVLLGALHDMNVGAVTSLEGAGLVVDAFNLGATLLQDAPNYQLTPDEHKKLITLRSQLARRQVSTLPTLRRKVGTVMGRELWKADTTVETSGAGDTTIEFVAGEFAAHSNIQSAQEKVQPILIKLRFKRAQYKWIPSADETWSYKMDSPADSAIAVIGSQGSVTLIAPLGGLPETKLP